MCVWGRRRLLHLVPRQGMVRLCRPPTPLHRQLSISRAIGRRSTVLVTVEGATPARLFPVLLENLVAGDEHYDILRLHRRRRLPRTPWLRRLVLLLALPRRTP